MGPKIEYMDERENIATLGRLPNPIPRMDDTRPLADYELCGYRVRVEREFGDVVRILAPSRAAAEAILNAHGVHLE